MKTMILILAAALALPACRKTDLGPSPMTADVQTEPAAGTAIQVNDNPIQGKWRLVRTTGGLRGVDMSAEEQGLIQTYEFGATDKCVLTVNDNVTNTIYTRYKAPSYTKGTDGDFVTIKGGETYEYYFAHDTLVLSWDVRMDGTVDWYVKE
ncbi:hypothetical protein GCM10023093_15060 [Nemorincola caseinilytica]|uniref:Lipocalin-like domain-containing protein n=1 Tax=Nemorincola caseinilytica TaxID=2054315 RepID=A0ABP8NBI0_9BACT